jgi:putative ABC transport system permease protein
MKNTLIKDFIREIKGNKGRFLSIFFIVLLGSAFFSGIRSSGGDMKYSADIYYDDTDMMDIRVLSTLGLTDDDINDIKNVSGIDEACGGYTKEVMVSSDGDEYCIRLIAQTEGINKLSIRDGRKIQNAGECIVDSYFMDMFGFEIGDTVSVYPGTDEDISDSLARTEFTIVGTGDLPYFTDLTRGVSSIGDGQLDGFTVVDPQAFDMDYYTEVYATVGGAKELNTYSDEYEALVSGVADGIEAISAGAAQRRYDEIYDEGAAQIEDAENEINDAKTELNDAKEELDSGKEELDDAAAQLSNAETELDSVLEKLNESKAQLDSAASQLESSASALEQMKAQIDSGESQLAGSWQQIEDGNSQLAALEAQLNSKAQEIETGKAELAQKQEEYEQQAAELENAKQMYSEAEKAYQAILVMLEADPENVELAAQAEALKAQADELSAVISQAEPVLTAAKEQLDAANAELAGYETQLAEGRAQLESYRQEIAAAKSQYDAGAAQLAEAKAQYEAYLSQYNVGKAEYDAGLSQYESGLSQYEEGRAEYESSLKEYEDGLAEWEDGNREYNEAYGEAQEEIEKAQEEIDDAKEELDSLSVPEWYILDRDDISSCSSYESDSGRMDSIGQIFPVLFFLVAALVSLTAMTRMAEEQRGQIGTLKALGYSNRAIAGKYVGYALLATLSGAVIGMFLGEYILPLVIMSAYGMLYVGIPQYYMPLNLTEGLLAIFISAACTGIAAVSSVYNLLRDKPAELMRPESPKSGRRIFLEHIPFIWKRLNFTQKATLRNLFRYKKRFVMTIIGISGCMSLMLVGFGLRDSITIVAQNQFKEIFMQNATVSVDPDEDRSNLEEAIAGYDGISASLDAYQLTVTLNANDTDRDAYIYVPKDTEKFFDFVRFRDRITKEPYDFPENGIALSEKTADMLGVSVGDTVSIQKGEEAEQVEATVETIVENYVLHYVFMSPETYAKLFGEEPEYNCIYLKYEDNSPGYENALGNTLLNYDECTGISFTTDLEKQIDDMLTTLYLVIAVLIIAAALLAFVVLYNLNSINMTERKRELATLKVLGFYDIEVAMYIYRENIILTLFGIAAGAVMGKLLHLVTITTIEVDQMMFGRIIRPESYVICALLTLAFSLLVNVIMFFEFRKIDMIESLKSVE